MAIKITGYRIYKSSGGNTCIQCGTRMRKGLPYMSPVTGKKNPRELRGKSICVACIGSLTGEVDRRVNECGEKEIDRYQKRRFLEHFD